MDKVLWVLMLLVASGITACDIPPPPDDTNDQAAEATEVAVESTVRSQVRSETIETTQGVVIRFEDGRFEARMPEGFGTPGFDSIQQPRIIINRHIARSGNRLAMVGWNEHEETFFETVVMDSFLNVAKFTTLRQMEGELVSEERFSYRGYPCIRFVIRYQDVDRMAAPPPEANGAKNGAANNGPKEKIDVYSRYEFITAPPYLFQMTFSTPDEAELDSEAINAFFGSFHFEIEPYDPDVYN